MSDENAFLAAYTRANEALEKGDTATARKFFLVAARLADEQAATGARELSEKRRERAKRLYDIADSLAPAKKQANKSAGKTDADGARGDADADEFFKPADPNEKISFDDIIGLADAKAAIHRILIDPLKSPEIYGRYGIKAGGFILLEGPPGTGKTTFAKAAASELEVPFAEIDSNSLINSYIGETGKNIDKLFSSARTYAKNCGKPVVMFLDEIDCLAQRRGGENKTAAEAVPTLIKQMDGFSTSSENIVIIAATNIKDVLDPAIISRFGNVINIPLPTENERAEMFKAKLKMLSDSDSAQMDYAQAAHAADGFSGRDITQVTGRFKSALAARDAGFEKIEKPLGEYLCELISIHKKSK